MVRWLLVAVEVIATVEAGIVILRKLRRYRRRY